VEIPPRPVDQDQVSASYGEGFSGRPAAPQATTHTIDLISQNRNNAVMMHQDETISP
jgi:hypothetical protein